MNRPERVPNRRPRRLRPLIRELEDFYIRNPEEVLSIADVTVKFDASYANARDAIYKLRQVRFVESILPGDEGGVTVYGRPVRSRSDL